MKMYKNSEICEIVYKMEIAKNVFDMKVRSDNISKTATCGQFLHIKCGGDSYLRRPISICDAQGDLVRFVFEVRGKATLALSQKNVGEYIDVLGALGTGYDTSSKYKNAIVVGGGIGIFPLLMICKKLKASAILGFRNKAAVVLENDFKKVCDNVFITTDDGSYATNGLVTDVLKEKLKENKPDIIYACGPLAMLRAVSDLALAYNIPCQISLEQRMACGIGACLGCATKVKSAKILKDCSCGDEADFEYVHVCKEGPVFWANEVMFDE